MTRGVGDVDCETWWRRRRAVLQWAPILFRCTCRPTLGWRLRPQGSTTRRCKGGAAASGWFTDLRNRLDGLARAGQV